MLSMSYRATGGVLCSICEEEDCTTYCQQCDRRICQECDEIIHLVSGKANHKRVALNGFFAFFLSLPMPLLLQRLLPRLPLRSNSRRQAATTDRVLTVRPLPRTTKTKSTTQMVHQASTLRLQATALPMVDTIRVTRITTSRQRLTVAATINPADIIINLHPQRHTAHRTQVRCRQLHMSQQMMI